MIVSNWVAVIDADRTRPRAALNGRAAAGPRPAARSPSLGLLEQDRPARHRRRAPTRSPAPARCRRAGRPGARQKRSVARARSAADMPGPVVAHRHHDRARPRSTTSTSTALPVGRDAERVVEQVVEHLLEPARDDPHRRRRRCGRAPASTPCSSASGLHRATASAATSAASTVLDRRSPTRCGRARAAPRPAGRGVPARRRSPPGRRGRARGRRRRRARCPRATRCAAAAR